MAWSSTFPGVREAVSVSAGLFGAFGAAAVRKTPAVSAVRISFPEWLCWWTIRHAVWLYLRFTLSYRDVEDLLVERGLEVSYETVRRWVLRFQSCCSRPEHSGM